MIMFWLTDFSKNPYWNQTFFQFSGAFIGVQVGFSVLVFLAHPTLDCDPKHHLKPYHHGFGIHDHVILLGENRQGEKSQIHYSGKGSIPSWILFDILSGKHSQRLPCRDNCMFHFLAIVVQGKHNRNAYNSSNGEDPYTAKKPNVLRTRR